MDFSLNEVQSDVREMAAKFAAKELAPIVDEDERQSNFRKELFLKFGEAGLIGITSSTKYGGSELGTMEYSLVLEELAAVASGYAVSFSVTGLPIRIIEQMGNEEQKAKYLPKLISGEYLGAFCLTEANSGSDASSLKTTATENGDSFIINGVKQYITNGAHSDVMVVMARTGAEGAKGISAFIVETKWNGVKGAKLEKKMGMRSSPTQEMIFENVHVPKENMIGQQGEGFITAMKALDSGRISIASIANGISRSALSVATNYAKEREQFGKPIIKFQGVSFLLANMAVELEASILLTRQAAYLKDAGKPYTKEASIAKYKSTEACMKITTDAVQVLGGYGYIEEFRVERYMREAKMLQLVEGTSQIQQLVIARNL